jgi:glycosidase
MPKHLVKMAKLITPLLLLLMLIVVISTSAVTATGEIDTTLIRHDSRDDLYRTPGGAVTFGTEIILRLRTPAGDIDFVNLQTYDLRNQLQFTIPMNIATTTADGYVFWEATLSAGEETTVYYYRFILQIGEITIFYEDDTVDASGQYHAVNKGGNGMAYPVSRDATYQIAVYDPEFYTPQWFRNGIIYQIFPDRFRDGDTSNNPEDGSEIFYGNMPLIFNEVWNAPMVDGRETFLPEGGGYWNSDFYGGDLAGVTDKLDYLQELGVTTIYLNPIFEARSNHRYDTVDYLAVDPMLGTMDDFQALVTEAEARGMYIVLDGVFNHMSSDSVYFDRYHRFETVGACESVDSEYRSWFTFRETRGTESAMCAGEEGDLFYNSWWNFDSIPTIDNTKYGPRAYFVRGQDSVVRTWGEAGIGGWRMDVGGDIDNGRDPDNKYWESFRTIARIVNPETVIIGEEWGDATPWLLGAQWDSVMNYRFRRAATSVVLQDTYIDKDGIFPVLTPYQFDNIIRSIEEDYPQPAYHAMMNLLDSHDTARIFFVLGNNTQSQKLAAMLQYTLPGTPTIYYGDEISIDAPGKLDGNTMQVDPYNRAPYPWTDTEGDHYPPPNEDMLTYYQMLGQIRTENPALSEGEMITLYADDEPGIYAYLRISGGNSVLVVINTAEEAKTVDLGFKGHLPSTFSLDSAFTEDSLAIEDGMTTIEMDARSGNVWTMNVAALPLSQGPFAPTEINATGNSGSVDVGWDEVINATGYIVYRSPLAVGGFQPISNMLTETTYTDTSVVNGFIYHYAVVAVNGYGLKGEISDSTAAIPADLIGSVGFSETTNAENSVTLAYGVTVPVQSFIMIDGVTGSGEEQLGIRAEIALSSADVASYWQPMTYSASENGADLYDAALPLFAAGEFEVMARFSTDAGQTWTQATLPDGSTPLLIVMASDDSTPPSMPADFTINQASISGVALSWSPVASDDLVVYQLYRVQNETMALVTELGIDATNYTDTGVAPGNTYSYALVAIDNALNQSEKAITPSVLVERSRLPVTFLVHVPDYTDGTLYLAGDLGDSELPVWDPAGIEMSAAGENLWAVTLELVEGTSLEYKFARGSWDGVEKGEECEELAANRRLTISFDTLGEIGEDGTYTVEHTVAKWRDLDNCP